MGKSASSAPSRPARVLQIPGKLGKSQADLKENDEKIEQGEPLLKGKKKRKQKKVERREQNDSGSNSGSKHTNEMVHEVSTLTKAATSQDKAPKPEAVNRPAARVLQIPGKSSFSSEKRRFMSDKVADIRSKPKAPKEKRKGGDTEESAEFKKTLKDVLNFVVPQLGSSERRQYDQAKIRALGGTLEKRAHEPYSVLQKRWKKQEEIRREKLAEEKTLGVSLSAVKHRNRQSGEAAIKRKEQARLEKKRRKESDILGLGAGARERRGMVVLPKNRVKAYS